MVSRNLFIMATGLLLGAFLTQPSSGAERDLPFDLSADCLFERLPLGPEDEGLKIPLTTEKMTEPFAVALHFHNFAMNKTSQYYWGFVSTSILAKVHMQTDENSLIHVQIELLRRTQQNVRGFWARLYMDDVEELLLKVEDQTESLFGYSTDHLKDSKERRLLRVSTGHEFRLSCN